ncbi:MAG TPA: UbiA family prenyltransferase [Terracidiphilus sp.]|nr:UbiA family prenyltransferase [Terracidiphilus sp.]
MSTWLAGSFRTIRPLSSLVAGVLASASVAAASGRTTLSIAFAGFAMTALVMFGFTVNDIFDYRKDRAAEIERPIARGTFSRHRASWLAAILLLFACLFGVLAAHGTTVLAITGAALFFYSPIARRYPLSKNPYAAALCCAPLYYGALVGRAYYPWSSYAVLACFALGREILMDADELSGDIKGGVRTIAARLGHWRTMRIGSGLMLISAAVLAVLVHGRLAELTAVATFVGLTWVLCRPGLDDRMRIRLSRVPMLLGAVAVAFGGT